MFFFLRLFPLLSYSLVSQAVKVSFCFFIAVICKNVFLYEVKKKVGTKDVFLDLKESLEYHLHFNSCINQCLPELGGLVPNYVEMSAAEDAL